MYQCDVEASLESASAGADAGSESGYQTRMAVKMRKICAGGFEYEEML